MQSHGRFESSYVALLANLWEELETILCRHYAQDSSSADARERAGLRLETLQLELVLLRDKCEFLSSRGLLAPEQAALVRVVVDDLHDLLDVEPFNSALPRAGAAIVRAQNRLFDELQCVARRTAPVESQRVA